MKTKQYRPISLLKQDGDVEWLAKQKCPNCDTRGRLSFGMHPREVLTCNECGHRMRIKGRPL